MNSGRMVERRDQVLIGFFSLPSTAASTFLIRCASTNGPFLIERDMLFAPYLRLRRWTIMLLVRLLRRVLKPLAGVPHGLTGSRPRSAEHTSELQSPMLHSYAVFCLKKKNNL